jgi:hypothetical protein
MTMTTTVLMFLFWFVGAQLALLAIPLVRRRVGPNQLYGLRTRETLADEDVWYEANARSGRDLVRLGLGTVAASSALVAVPWRAPEHYALVCAGLLVVGVVVYAVRGLRIARAVAREKSTVV